MTFFDTVEAHVLQILNQFNATDKSGVKYQSILCNYKLYNSKNLQNVLASLEEKDVVRLTDRMVFFTLKGMQLLHPANSVLKVDEHMEWTLEQKKAARFRFLEILYQETNGSEQAIVSMFDIGEKAGLERETTIDIFDYLRGESLVEAIAIGGIIKITHFGVKEYEQAIKNPEDETQYFPPAKIVNNILNIEGDVSGTQIQQGSIASQQHQAKTDGALLELKQWIDNLNSKLDELALPPQHHSKIIDELGTIRALLSTTKPKRSFLKESLATIRSILEGIAGNALVAALLTSIPSI